MREGPKQSRDPQAEAEAEALQAQYDASARAAAARFDAEAMVVFDLQELQFMDSTGLRIILALRERCQEHGVQFAITRSSDQVQRLLSVTGAAEHLRTIAAVDG